MSRSTTTNPRCASGFVYIAEFGRESWELDALRPDVLRDLISDAVLGLRNEDTWSKRVAEEEEHRERLRELSCR